MDKKFKVGETIWAILRDEEYGDTYLTSFIFIAKYENYIIAVVPSYFGKELKDMLEELRIETSRDYSTSSLAVIDERDCYSTRIEAEDALGGEE